ncbi:cell wall binding repeat 2-containing protein [Syntrophobotulus glycolicus DSM 8271]|uniref:Cell wall binding repeat 2-containing protein n=1 Tax=Syntrophobotulus glycolicus (strain DSM 8271 / FlGlyR) TaxID=645991 RepID=F0SX01_SYNGF|nr:NEAT domain-containing protein [Syntrophobotulus glycolicus]ADY55784.1 cell wall binding repeat 2-containing protein [Syntrophobotulus glycolicus DSM 8271]
MNKKFISILLSVLMVLSLFPVPMLAGDGEDVEITGFAPIEIDGGTTGSAAYENVEAVIEYLNTAYASVQADTASDTVAVPVSGWTETDSYDPNTVGSYTFTATLGEIPVGYANTGGYTAAAEVKIEAGESGDIEITGFAPITVAGGTTGSAAYENAQAVIEYLNTAYASVQADTASDTVAVPVSGWTETDSYDPNTVGSYTFTATLGEIPAGYANTGGYTAAAEVKIEAGESGDIEITGFAPITVAGGTTGSAAYENAEAVIEYLNTAYASVQADTASDTVAVPVSGWTETDSYDPNTVGSYTFTATLGEIPAGYANTGGYTAAAEVKIEAGESGDIEITGFAPITVAGGTTGSAAYENAEAVIEYLNTAYASVQADTASDTVAVPVSGWTETDSYDPNTVGSYTFTATLGEIPAGYANTGGYTTAAEVKIEAGESGDIEITGFAPITVNAGLAGAASYPDAAAVITHLNENYCSVTALTTGNTAGVSVPVTGWEGDDSAPYNPEVAGSYSFRAQLGDIPAGYALGEGVTATVEVTVTNVTAITVNRSNSTVSPSIPVTFTAVVSGIGEYNSTVEWSIVEPVVEGTTISEGGVLSIASGETAGTLTVKATSQADRNQYATASVSVITVSSISLSPASSTVAPGGKVTLTPSMSGNNISTTRKVTWSIDGNSSSNTKLSASGSQMLSTKPTLTIGSDETATAITVTITSDNDKSKSASATITIKPVPDETLNKAIAAILHQNEGYQVTLSDLQGLTTLDLSDREITDISALANATNLENLNLSGNPIIESTYSALGSLTKVKELNLSNCMNRGMRGLMPSGLLTALKKMSALEILDISQNNLMRGISSGNTLGSLKSLDISDNAIYALKLAGNSCVAGKEYMPNLEQLDISGNYLDISDSEVSAEIQSLANSGVTVTYESQKDLSALYAISLINYGGKAVYFDNTTKTADLGSVVAGKSDIKLVSFAGASTVSIAGESYSADVIATSPEIAVDFEEGNNIFQITSTHANGDTSTYTVHYTGEGLPSNEAGIKDANLYIALCGLLGKEPTETITIAQLNGLYVNGGWLDLSGLAIADASGLQYVTRTKTLSLDNNQLADLPDLSGLTALDSLSLNNNQFTEIPVTLNEIPTLTVLYLNDNRLTALNGRLDKLTALKTLYLDGNRITDFTDLVSSNSGLGSLSALHLQKNGLAALPGDLSRLSSLTALYIGGNLFTEIPAGVFTLSALETLDFSTCKVTELPAGLASLNNLKAIHADYNAISVIDTALSGMTSLLSIDLTANGLTVIPDNVLSIKSLTGLSLDSNSLKTIPGNLANLENLQGISLDGCLLTEIPAVLLEMSKLSSISLSNNSIENMDVDWSRLTNLRQLYLDYNRLGNVASDLSKTALNSLSLDYNLITALSVEQVNNLPDTLQGSSMSLKYNFIKWNEAVEEALISKDPRYASTINLAKAYVMYFAALKEIGLEGQDNVQVATSPTTRNSLTVMVSEGTGSIKLTPQAVFADTVITCNGANYHSGEEISFSGLTPGKNSVVLQTSNEYDNSAVVYHITVFVAGGDMGAEFPTSGHEYEVQLKILQKASNSGSMAAAYVDKTGTIEVTQDGEIYLYFTTYVPEWLSDVKYKSAESTAAYIDTEIVESTSSSLRHKIPISNITDFVYITGYVVPMGYAPEFRLVFDPDTLVDLTTGTGVEIYNPDKDAKVTITDVDGVVTVGAGNLSDLLQTDNAALQIGSDITVSFPVGYLRSILDSNGGSEIKLEQTTAKTDNIVTSDGESIVTAMDLSLLVGEGKYTNEFGGTVKVTVTLTNEQVSQLQDSASRKICYYNESTQELELLTSNFDWETKTASFYTTHLSTFVIVATSTASDGNGDTIADGTYTIDADAMHETQENTYSMTNQFITEPTTLTVEDGQLTATMVWHRTELITMNMVKGLWYKDSQGEMIPVPGVPSEDTETLTVTIPIESLTEPTLFQVYAPQGMGESRPYFKLVFNTDTLVKIEDQLDPDHLPNGAYTIDADAMHETQENTYSMTNQFITEPTTLTVEDGQLTATMVWHRTELITMNMVKGLWYKDSQGEMIPVSGVPSEDTETLTVTIPIESLTEPTLFQVYAPQGMGESKPYFKLVFNLDTLSRVTGEDDIEITSFEAISIDAGAAPSVAYGDAAAVITHLNTNYASVTANDGAVSVPVAEWTDTDSYNPSVAGSYTFTAVLGAIPEGYANTSGIAATAEVVVKTPAEVPVSIPDANLKAAIKAALEKPGDHIITMGEMESLTSLDASDREIKDLTGLWTAVNLETLNLSGNPLGADVKGTPAYDNIFSGLENLAKLEYLGISHCALGVGGSANIPSSLQNSVVDLRNLVTYDLSNNQIDGYYMITQSLPKLRNLDLSENNLCELTIVSTGYLPVIEHINLNGNYIYLAEGQEGYESLVEIGLDKIDAGDMKNLAMLKSLRVAKTGGTVTSNYWEYTAGEEAEEIDAGQIFGGSITFACMSYAGADSVKVTVNGEAYTAQNFTYGIFAVPITVSGLPAGENTISIHAAHMNGTDTFDYTLKFTVAAVPSLEGSAGIQDAVLQKIVCDRLGKDYTTYVVTKGDMASLTGTISSTAFTNLEGLQYATGLTSLTLGGTFVSYPDLSGITGLTSLALRGSMAATPPSLSSLTELKTLTVATTPFTAFPSLEGLTKLTTLTIQNNTKLAGSLPNLANCQALTKLTITSTPGLTVPQAITEVPLTNLQMDYNNLTSIPDYIGQIETLTTLNLSSNSLTELPDLSGLTLLTGLTLTTNRFTDIPSTVAQLTSLKNLNLGKNPISLVQTDLNGLQALTSLDLSGCGLTEFPGDIPKLANLTTLYLQNNKLTALEGSMTGLSKLATLRIDNNRFDTLPMEIKALGALSTFYASGNYLTEIEDENFFAGFPKLTTVQLGNYIKCTYASSTYTPLAGSSAAKALAKLKEIRPTANVTFSMDTVTSRTSSDSDTIYAGLKALTTSAGTPEGHFDYYECSEAERLRRELAIYVPKDTSSITVTATGIYADTAIKVGNETITSGTPFAVDGLVNGPNIVRIDTHNPAGDDTVSYNLTIYVGSYTEDEEFPQEGKQYQIQAATYKEREQTLSMANQYIEKTVSFTYHDGQYEVLVTTNRNDYFQNFRYRNAEGELVDAEIVATGTPTALSATYRAYVDSLEDDLYIESYVIPMGYAPVFRLVFNMDTIVDITQGEDDPGQPLDPDHLPNGTYTIDADAMHETQENTYSMTNQFITEPTTLTVEDGQITATMVWHRTELITMNMVKGLWYKDSEGEMIPVPGVPSEDTETLTVTIPIESLTEPTIFQVYAPQGMGESRPYFKLVFNLDTLSKAGDPDPDKIPVKEISADQDTVTIGRNDIQGYTDRTQNIGLNFGDASITIPLQYLDSYLAGDPSGTGSLQLQKSEAAENEKQGVISILTGNDTLVGAIELNLSLISGANAQPVTDLGGRIKVTLSLTEAQVAQLDAADSMKLCYYNPATGLLENMGATFDLEKKTVTFYTDHFSTYAIVSTTSGSGGDGNGGDGGGGSGGTGGTGSGMTKGSYTISVSALKEDDNSTSMANQFIKERAGLSVSGDGSIAVTMVWYGTTSSPQASDGIHMTSVKKLQYKNSGGEWKDVKTTLDTANDTLTIKFTVDTISQPVYMRVKAKEMGPDYKVFRLVFNQSSLKEGRLVSESNLDSYTIKAEASDGGEISPSGNVKVKKDASQTFTITPNKGYKVKNVLVDSKSVGTVSTYTFKNVTTGHTISATFEKSDGTSFTDETATVFTSKDGVQVSIPGSALSGLPTPVEITIVAGTVKTSPQTEKTALVLDPAKYQRQFGIEGMAEGSIEFKAPVTITFPISLTDLPEGTTTAQLAVYWWNPSKNDWIKIGGVFDPQNNSISVPVYHFSTYAVMADTSTTPDRLAGGDRFATAVAIAEQGWKTGADTVVLANAYSFADALAAGPLAYKLNAPVLLSEARTLPAVTAAGIQKLAPKKIILIGGTGVLSQSIQDSLSATYGQENVVRYGGADRYATAAALASALGTTGRAVIANGEDGHYPDALAISSYASYLGVPILFTATNALPAVTEQTLTEQKVSASIVVGGEGAVPAGIYQQLPGATRYGGADRYATAAAIAEGLDLNLNQVFIATGLNFSDALVAGNLAARSFSPLLLVDKDLPQTVEGFLADNKEAISETIVVGGEKAVSPGQESAIKNVIKNNLPLPDAGTSESDLKDGKYTVEATALKEKADELSMTDQFLTEKATLTVSGGVISASMTWHGTEFVTMDMLKELKYQKMDGSLVDVNRVLDAANNTLTINFEIADLKEPTIMQVYVPAGMGESRPKFRLVLELDTLAAS